MKVTKATRDNPYHFDRCGLDNVLLIGIELYGCPRCGAVYPMIPRIQELHKAIAGSLVEKPTALTGQEVRYLRRWIGIEAQAFAELLGVTPEHLSKVENNRLTLGGAADRLVRVYAMTHKQQAEFEAISESVKRIKDARARARLRRQYQYNGSRWRVESEAVAA
jgi:DNA-binding transcriptional regulator YiaG